MNSLKFKILGTISCVVIIIAVLVSVSNYRKEQSTINKVVEHDTRLLTETIKNSIANSMRHGRSDEVGSILSRIKSEESIKSIRIVNAEGRVLNSADPGEISHTVNTANINLFDREKPFQLSSTPANGTFVALANIFNAPACHACHSPEKSVLGILQVELSLAYLQTFYSSLRTSLASSTLLMVVLLLILFSAFLLYYVDRPLSQLTNAMQRLQEGDFDCKTAITSSREMEDLSDCFNNMVDCLHQTMERTLDQELKLARSEEQLAHHHAIEEMNSRLALQVEEIAALNRTLTQRIDEIEEANYKISDLASELEDKNTVLEATVAKLSTLYRVGLGINATMDPDSLYSLIIRNTTETLHAGIGYIGLLNKSKTALSIKNLSGYDLDPSIVQPIPLESFQISRTVIQSGVPLLINDFDSSTYAPQSPLGFRRTSMLCVPLKVHKETIGTIVVANRIDGYSFSNDDLDLLATIASQASVAIKNAMLYDDLQIAYFNTIQALVSAIEASDSYTRGHSERVTRYALNLARRLDQPLDRMKILERAAVLHDIGKIGIDLTLLHKTGQLTPQDIDSLRQHPVIGMKIIEPITFLKDVKICIGQHHERFDGKGYPHSIPADQLLLESRILAIADAFDAMTSDRPYRKALPLEAAISELRAHAGSQFDPELVPHFIATVTSSQPALFSFDDNNHRAVANG